MHSVNYECTRCCSGKNDVLMNQILEDEEKVFEVNALSATRMEENRQINKQKLFNTEGRMYAMPQGRNKGVASLIISISVQWLGRVKETGQELKLQGLKAEQGNQSVQGILF